MSKIYQRLRKETAAHKLIRKLGRAIFKNEKGIDFLKVIIQQLEIMLFQELIKLYR